jgi:hypothetical protein
MMVAHITVLVRPHEAHDGAPVDGIAVLPQNSVAADAEIPGVS